MFTLHPAVSFIADNCDSAMKTKLYRSFRIGAFCVPPLLALPALADTTWTAGANTGLFSTAGNWNNGLPSTGPQLSIYAATALINDIRVIDIAGTARNSIGIRFDFAAGDNGFTFNTAATSLNIGMQSRAGGVNGILNNDDSTQTFNVPFRMFTSAGGSGAGAAQTINAAAGQIVFTGAYPGTSTNVTINNGGGMLTIAGAHNVTIGTTGRGDISGAGGLTKIDSGTLLLGGSLPNVYTGPTIISGGAVIANKDNAYGNLSSVTLDGGILNSGGFDHQFGTLDLNANSILDFGNGASDLVFLDSDLQDWGGMTLTIRNFTPGSDTLRVGTDGDGFDTQLPLFNFEDFGNMPAQIDASGFITPVPEPATPILVGVGVAALLMWRRNRR